MIDRLVAGGVPPRVTVVVAHPDDEIASFGGILRRLSLRGAVIDLIHVTDGAPRSMHDAAAAGFRRREDYARARRLELATALRVGDITIARMRALRVVDQEASFALADLAVTLAQLLEESRPEVVVTHPYEGGHPDHDATAFAVHTAISRMNTQPARPGIAELTSYHDGHEGMRVGRFLEAQPDSGRSVELTAEERRVKQQMLGAFTTQQHVLANFPVSPERIRAAPIYDFARPPHPGPLLYECFDWGITGAEWRARAAAARHSLAAAGQPRS